MFARRNRSVLLDGSGSAVAERLGRQPDGELGLAPAPERALNTKVAGHRVARRG